MAALIAAAAIAASSASATSTGYCLTGTMADGSYTRAGSIAHNGYPLGTRVTVWPSPTGRRHFVVRDRIGWGTELDFWLPTCGRAITWGRRTVHVRKGWRRSHLIGRVRRAKPRLGSMQRPIATLCHP
jgi:3D (Asp-Asp-Asp) domain-containing protein